MKRNVQSKKPQPTKKPEPTIVLSEEQQQPPTFDFDKAMAGAIKTLTNVFTKQHGNELTKKEQEIEKLKKDLEQMKEDLHIKECLIKEADKTKQEYFRTNKQLKDKIEILELRLKNEAVVEIPCAQQPTTISLEPLTVDPKLMDSRMAPEYVPADIKKRKPEKKPEPAKKKKKMSTDFFGSTVDDDLIFSDELVLLPDSQVTPK